MTRTRGPVRVGILGCGNVGATLVRLVDDHADVLEARAGVPIEIVRVAVRDLSKSRDVKLAPEVFTDDSASVVSDPDVDVVVEMIGGLEPARSLIVEALRGGKPVVTANKELIAQDGPELFAIAADAGVDLLFEASVAGGIPLLRPLRESLAGDRIRRVLGIVNGTTNYILTRMAEEGSSFDDALAEAQRLGYAEPDPTADIEGFDAAAKAAIIASIALRSRRSRGRVPRRDHWCHRRRHRVGGGARLRREAPGGRRGARGRHRRAGAPGDGSCAPSARSCPRIVQRGVHRGRGRRRAHALRAWGRGWPDRLGVARRPRRRGPQPRVRRARCDDR